MESIDKPELELEGPFVSTRNLVSHGTGEILLEVVSCFSSLFTTNLTEFSELEKTVVKICKNLIGATWVEVLMHEEHYLKVLGRFQSLAKIDYNSDSLPGFVAEHKMYQIVNNAQTSNFYLSFPQKLLPYCKATKKLSEPTSLCAVPIIDQQSAQVLGVVVLYNKLGPNNQPTYFTLNDVNIVQALGVLLTGVVTSWKKFTELNQKNLSYLKAETQCSKLSCFSNKLIKRKNLLLKLEEIIEENNSINEELLELLNECMESSALALYTLKNENLEPFITQGNLKTNSSKYVAFSKSKLLNIPDLSSEPLTAEEKSPMKSSLSHAITQEDKTLGVIEFFRATGNFNEVDENFVKRISRVLRKPLENYQPQIKGLESLRHFSLRSHKLLDFKCLFEEVRKTCRKLVEFDACSVYLIDQVEQVAWTQGFSDTLSVSLHENNLLAYVYSQKNSLTLPCSPLPSFYEPYFSGKSVLSVPFLSKLSKDSVIGVLVLTRKHAFQENELSYLSAFAKSFSNTLEALHLSSFKDPKEVSGEFKRKQYKKRTKIYIPKKNPEVPNNYSTLCNLLEINKIPYEKQAMLLDLKEKLLLSKNPLKTLAESLSSISSCKVADVLIKNSTDEFFTSLKQSRSFEISGLIGLCLRKNSTVLAKESPSSNSFFDPKTDLLGKSFPIKNFLALPICSRSKKNQGALCFINSESDFAEEDLKFFEYLVVVIRELFKSEDLEDLENLLVESRLQKILFDCSKQIFSATNYTQSKIVLASNILQKISVELNLESLISNALEVLRALVNSENAKAIYFSEEKFYSFNIVESQLCMLPTEEECTLWKQILESRQCFTCGRTEQFENKFIFPLNKGTNGLLIELFNKKDESFISYCEYTERDQKIVEDFAEEMFAPIESFMQEKTPSTKSLRETVRRYIFTFDNFSFFHSIKLSGQRLVECEKATLYVKSGKKLFSVDNDSALEVVLGKGIVGTVAQTGKLENIKDVHNDSRFNKQEDFVTGYRTSSMLCVPIFDCKNKVIGVLQLTNKKNGCFGTEDEQAVLSFSEIISSFIQNWELFQSYADKNSKLQSIANSIGNYVLVLDSKGHLSYNNKPLFDLFGVNESFAKNNHFSSWLKYNRQLLVDLTNIYKYTMKKIKRTSQKVVQMPIRKTNSIPDLNSFNFSDSAQKVFNYSLVTLKDFCISQGGVMLILEDASAIEELNSRFKSMQNQLMALQNPVKTETSLQKCINKLLLIAGKFDPVSDENLQIKEIVSTLKRGNLYQAEVQIPPELMSLEGEIKSRLKEYTQPERVENHHSSRNYSRRFSIDENIEDLGVELEYIRNWNLDAFEVKDHSKYIRAMLRDFNLQRMFLIRSSTLRNFVSKVQENYSIYENAFHNFYHGFSVMHSVYFLLSATPADELFNPHELLAILVAALCHDIGHTGYTNTFEVNRQSRLAIIYNDNAVLENHHAALTFQILRNNSTNIFQNMNEDTYKAVRKLMISCILDTEMTRHFNIISSLTERFKDKEESPLGTVEQDYEKLAGFLVHCGDLSHPAKEFNLFSKWSRLVCEEFSRQYNEELKQNLPVSEFMKNLEEPVYYFKNEIGFVSVLIKPLWECLNLWLRPHLNQCMQNIDKNIEEYKKRVEELEG